VAYGINNITISLFFLINIIILVCLNIINSYAHIPQDTKIVAPIQEWRNTQDNVKIQFSYIPKNPLVYTETDLIFSIQDLSTGNHIKDLIANIVVTKNDKIFFKFNDVDLHDGDLSLKVRFVEDGNYKVISQLRSTDNLGIALASFDIHVPLQPFGKFNANSLVSLLIPAALVAISLSAVVIAFILILRKRGKASKTS
jgi:hypothetical protein